MGPRPARLTWAIGGTRIAHATTSGSSWRPRSSAPCARARHSTTLFRCVYGVWSCVLRARVRMRVTVASQCRQEVYRLWKCTLVMQGATCYFPQDPSTGLPSGPWNQTTMPHGAVSNGRVDRYVKNASVFPPVQFQEQYFRDCSGAPVRDCWSRMPWSNDGLACPQFCSFVELKAWIDAAYAPLFNLALAEDIERIDVLLFDLKYAVDLLDTASDYSTPHSPDDDEMQFGDDVADLFRLDADGKPLRLDTCQCEWLLRCPNGTVSAPGASSIFNCSVAAERTVLQRIVPIPYWQFPFEGGYDQLQLSDYWDAQSHVGRIKLLGWETAVITLNMTSLAPNFTYFDHYQFSVYADCLPCPARYKCVADGNSGWTCSNLLPTGLADPALCASCCSCQRKTMPSWFEMNDPVSHVMVSSNVRTDDPANPLFPAFDNKHILVQVSLLALQNTTLFFCVELLHGLYYTEFQEGLSNMAGMRVALVCTAMRFIACWCECRHRHSPAEPGLGITGPAVHLSVRA